MIFDVSSFAKLARIKLTKAEKQKIGEDLSGILGHFKELEALDTENVPPVVGGADIVNVFRDDVPREKGRGDVVRLFPVRRGGHLRVPKVFD